MPRLTGYELLLEYQAIEPELLEALARAAKSEQARSRQDASRDAQRPWASAQSKQRRDQLVKRREARTCLFKHFRIVVSGVTTAIDPV